MHLHSGLVPFFILNGIGLIWASLHGDVELFREQLAKDEVEDGKDRVQKLFPNRHQSSGATTEFEWTVRTRILGEMGLRHPNESIAAMIDKRIQKAEKEKTKRSEPEDSRSDYSESESESSSGNESNYSASSPSVDESDPSGSFEESELSKPFEEFDQSKSEESDQLKSSEESDESLSDESDSSSNSSSDGSNSSSNSSSDESNSSSNSSSDESNSSSNSSLSPSLEEKLVLGWFPHRSLNRTCTARTVENCSFVERIAFGRRSKALSLTTWGSTSYFGFNCKGEYILVSDGLASNDKAQKIRTKTTTYNQADKLVTRDILRTQKKFSKHYPIDKGALMVAINVIAGSKMKRTILLRSFGELPLAAVVLRPDGKYYKPVHFSAPQKLVERTVRTGDIVIIGLKSSVNKDNRKLGKFRTSLRLATIVERLFDQSGLDRGAIFASRIEF